MGTRVLKLKEKETISRKEEKKEIEEIKVKKKKEKEIKVERPVVRLIDTDIDGTLPIRRAIWKIKGVSFSYGNAVCKVFKEVTGIDREFLIGNLNDEQIQILEDIIRNPQKYNIPSWLYNRRKDIYDGKDYHIVGDDVKIKMQFDIKREIELGTYRGWRHKLGQPVRGQRTRSHFRRGQTVGVIRSKEARAQQSKK
ncbi:MAG: 30S ribosomal protein S13 [Candidatus Aenigmatarchaeota archaeon]|nr:30S ribosomal protein S13 [Candidatus Aenigmarchaeota archaeon]